MLSQLLHPVLRERFPDRGLAAGEPPDPCARFPGIHPGIRGVSIYDDGDRGFTVYVDRRRVFHADTPSSVVWEADEDDYFR